MLVALETTRDHAGSPKAARKAASRGRAAERPLLCRQAARKFDADAAQRLATALSDVADPERLAQVGDWIIEWRNGSQP